MHLIDQDYFILDNTECRLIQDILSSSFIYSRLFQMQSMSLVSLLRMIKINHTLNHLCKQSFPLNKVDFSSYSELDPDNKVSIGLINACEEHQSIVNQCKKINEEVDSFTIKIGLNLIVWLQKKMATLSHQMAGLVISYDARLLEIPEEELAIDSLMDVLNKNDSKAALEASIERVKQGQAVKHPLINE